jgi:hypothetical protein
MLKKRIRWKPFVDLTGRTFGRLHVTRFVSFNHHHRAQFLVECSCGNIRVVLGNNLLSGHTTSCSCARTEKTVARNHLGKGIARGPRKPGQKTT